MKMWVLWIALLLAPALGAAQAPGESPATQPASASRVLIVSIDGMRPDCALRADMPHLRELMSRGTFTFWARTTDVAITLPSHTSMLTGVPPDKHRITWNVDVPHPEQPYPAWPTIFDLAKKSGHTTACVAGKSKFRIFDRPGALDWKFIREASDDEVADAAAAIIWEHHPDVLFVHFPDCDRTGHAKGWGTPQQIKTITHADHCLGRVLDALESTHLLDATLVIVTADHGGAGRNHGAGDQRSLHIPWVAAGPGVKHNYDLTQNAGLIVHTEDTFATACQVLGIAVTRPVDGKPVDDIFERQELLHAAPSSQ